MATEKTATILARLEEKHIALHTKIDQFIEEFRPAVIALKKSTDAHAQDLRVIKRDRWWVTILAGGAFTAIVEWWRK
jgi:hypothetical protein